MIKSEKRANRSKPDMDKTCDENIQKSSYRRWSAEVANEIFYSQTKNGGDAQLNGSVKMSSRY